MMHAAMKYIPPLAPNQEQTVDTVDTDCQSLAGGQRCLQLMAFILYFAHLAT